MRAELRAGRSRAGRLRRRPGAHRSAAGARGAPGLRDDAVLHAPPVRRVRLGPDGGHLAGLPPPRLRVVRRGARSALIIDNAKCAITTRLHARPAGATRLCRVRRGLRLQDRRVPAARPAEEGHRRGRASSTSRATSCPRAVPRSGRPERAGAPVGDGGSRRAHARHHARAAAGAVRARAAAAAAAAGDRARTWALAPRRACIATATCSSSARCTRRRSRWWARRCGCAPPTARSRSIRTTATWPPTCAAQRPGERRTRARSPAARGASASSRTTAHWCLAASRAIGPACAELVEQLLGDRIVERLRAAQGVLRLGERYGPRGWRPRAPARWRTTRRTTAPSRLCRPAARSCSRSIASPDRE